MIFPRSIKLAPVPGGSSHTQTAGRLLCLGSLLFALSVSGTEYNWTNSQATGYAPGDTVKLWGTFSASLTLTNSGTAASPITFQMQPGAKFSAATWSSYIINLNGQSHIVWDGGTLEATDNGTSRTYQNSFAAFEGRSDYATNIVIKNVAISDLYVRTGTTDATLGCVGVECWDISGLVITNCTFTNMYAWWWIQADDVGCTNILITGCKFVKSRGSVTSVRTSKPMRQVVIDRNDFDDMQPWYDDANVFHCEYMQMYAQGAGVAALSEVTIKNNTFGVLTGAGTHTHSTAFIYLSEKMDDIYIFNNVMVAREGTENCSNAFISIVASSLTDMDILIANNTFAGSSNGWGRAMQLQATEPSTITCIVSNNLVTGLATAYYTSGSENAVCFRDRNLYFGNISQSQAAIQAWSGGGDTNSVFADDPKINFDCTLQASSPAIGAGWPIGATYDLDRNQVSRGSSVDLGAYEFQSAPSTVHIGTATVTTLKIQ